MRRSILYLYYQKLRRNHPPAHPVHHDATRQLQTLWAKAYSVGVGEELSNELKGVDQ